MKILVADDDLIYGKLLEATLPEWGYEVQLVRDGASALAVLKAEDAPRLAILDWMMPGLDGIQVCRELRQNMRSTYTYVILLSAKNYKGDLVAGLQAGADDYLIKPFDPHELKARLYAGRRILDLQAQLIEAREAMRHQATRDHLTGAWNHRAIVEILEREWTRGKRENKPVAVVMADLDHFKRINDTHGHLGGDAVLREMGLRFLNSMRPYDMVGRYGGEEFLIVLPGCDLPRAVAFAERVRERIGGEPVQFHAKAIAVTVSQGVTVFGASDDTHSLLERADQALYRAKKNGRNRVESA